MAEIKGVEIFATGVWNGTQILLRDLEEMVSNFHLFQGKVRVPLKLGHNKKQPLTDGQPALGWVSNLRIEGRKLLADFVDMPKKVFDVVKARMFDAVSVEIMFAVENGDKIVGTTLEAVALLGADLPAVSDLDGLANLLTTRIPGYKHAVFTFAVNGGVLDDTSGNVDEDFQGARAVNDGKVESGGGPDGGIDAEPNTAQQENSMSDEMKALRAEMAEMKTAFSSVKAENEGLKSSNTDYVEKFAAQEADATRQEAKATVELFTAKRDALMETLAASVKEGKLTPAIKTQIEVEIETQREDFSRNGKTLLFSTEALLAAADSAQLPKGEQGTGTGTGASEEGRKIEDASEELSDKALEYQWKQGKTDGGAFKMSYQDAEAHIIETDNVLAAAYASQQAYPEEA